MEPSRIINGFEHIAYNKEIYEPEEMNTRSEEFYRFMDLRRTVRDISDRPVPREVMENLIMTASTAPSGAHKQPWTFCLVSDPQLKSQIRSAAEKEEYESYNHRMSEEWIQDLKALGTNHEKPFLETAPWLIIVFKKVYDIDGEGNRKTNYYVNESVGIACGILLTAIHHAGLVALTHTPSPMNFLFKLLARPENERPFLLIPVGYPDDEVYVPNISRKPMGEIGVFY